MTDLIEPKPDIDALLNAGTYQNMSDAEIDALIAYRVERATREATISRDAQAHDEIMRELMEWQADAQTKANASMQEALNTQVTYKEV
jgi:hypothetical protein